MNKIKIFVINMNRATERRSRMLKHINDIGHDAEFIEAVDGSKINRANLDNRVDPRLSNGELGCYLSHVKSWKEVKRQKLDYAIILEDDVICRDDMTRIIQEIIKKNLPFDAVRLSALCPIKGKDIAKITDNYTLILPNKNPSGTQGYLVSLKGVERMLEKISIPKLPIDTTLDYYWKNGLCIPIISPTLVAENSSICSSIDQRFKIKKRNFIQHINRVIEAKRRKITVFLMSEIIRIRYKNLINK